MRYSSVSSGLMLIRITALLLLSRRWGEGEEGKGYDKKLEKDTQTKRKIAKSISI